MIKKSHIGWNQIFDLMRMSMLYTLILCCFSMLHVKAQNTEDKSFKRATLTIPVGVAFDKVVDYLQEADFFITALDKQAGFIQAKVFEKDRKVISATMGERKTYNFILRPLDDKTKVTLNIYLEEYNFGGQVQSRSYYYEDKGISKKEKDYQAVLTALSDAMQN